MAERRVPQDNIKRLMREKNLSRRDLISMSGLDGSSIDWVVYGKQMRWYGDKTVMAIAKALRVDARDLYIVGYCQEGVCTTPIRKLSRMDPDEKYCDKHKKWYQTPKPATGRKGVVKRAKQRTETMCWECGRKFFYTKKKKDIRYCEFCIPVTKKTNRFMKEAKVFAKKNEK